jgi:hypothetical protein
MWFDPKLSRQTGVSHIDLSLGGWAPAYTASAGAVLGAGALSDGAPTTVENQPSCTVTASSLWTDSIAKGEQNGVH